MLLSEAEESETQIFHWWNGSLPRLVHFNPNRPDGWFTSSAGSIKEFRVGLACLVGLCGEELDMDKSMPLEECDAVHGVFECMPDLQVGKHPGGGEIRTTQCLRSGVRLDHQLAIA